MAGSETGLITATALLALAARPPAAPPGQLRRQGGGRNAASGDGPAFKETFPGETAIVDVPPQMRGKINELQKKTKLYGATAAARLLSVLREI
jgi:hypothetical protein